MRQMENDEVCAELRQLTSQLRRVSDLNLKRSQVLLDEAVRLPKQLRRWSQQTASPPGLVPPYGRTCTRDLGGSRILTESHACSLFSGEASVAGQG